MSTAASPRRWSRSTTATTTVLRESADDSAATARLTELEASQQRETPKLTSEDATLVKTLHAACGGSVEAMENAITANLENMSPSLAVALQMAAERGEWRASGDGDDDDDDGGGASKEEFETQMVELGAALRSVLDVRLRSGRELLADLLKSGEIRKLDSTIGKAAREGRIDMSFFTVLSMNMRDAALEDDGAGDDAVSRTLEAGEGQEEITGEEEGRPAEGASRLQILQHIYTRAQEELEKNAAPGAGLLNKVLRTEISSIRANQLAHYLGPQATSITSPDGKTIDLGGTGKPLVSHVEFVEALTDAVNRIRTLEAAGGTDRLSAMNLLESIRKVAIEARGALVESFGEDSDAVQEFQRDLQPAFRPGSKLEEGQS